MQRNVKEILDVNGVRVLVDHITLAHLHTSRATVPLQVSLYQLGKYYFISCNDTNKIDVKMKGPHPTSRLAPDCSLLGGEIKGDVTLVHSPLTSEVRFLDLVSHVIRVITCNDVIITCNHM